ncbi:MAG: hypothetical protein EBT93_10100, partial [Alphaproteobacteria bacterium]|nr:hypothetical protein [Alphaproteobacteria bacterium]
MEKLCKYFVLQNTRVPNPFPVLIYFLILFFSIKGLKKYSVILRSLQALLSKDKVRLSAFFDLFLLMFAASQHQNKQLDFSAIFINGL